MTKQPIIHHHSTETYTDKNGYSFSIVKNDENKVRTYILKNGLTVFLAQNFDAPRIQTYIPVKTGSNNDPADNTGLSHYLEHMLFKGSSKLGTTNWEKEKKLLDEIEDLYETHKTANSTEEKEEIYRKIDAISQQASAYAVANEYDKIISSLGATGTNAHTWLDETVYKNNIPKNELENWLRVEKERFSELVLRLFHTELESVYEEFNRAQDNDGRLVNYALMEELFPTHPNGQQTTLGKAEHLKNPSMKAIYRYFYQYYVPNNYALVLVGDLDFEETIRLIDLYFGGFERKELPEKKKIVEMPLTSVKTRTVKSPTIPRVHLAWRSDNYGTREAMLLDVIANILSNKGEAGILDLEINQEQKMLGAYAFSVGFKQYGYFSMVGVPKEDQTLEEARTMLLEEIEKIKSGNFADWLLPAIIQDFKVQRLKSWETADGLATTLYDTFIKGRSWQDEINEMPQYAAFTKEEIVAFANNFFKNNEVVIYKEQGENENLIRIDNPGITPIQLNREGKSEFFKWIESQKTTEIEPYFIDYQKEIQTAEIQGKKIHHLYNLYNDIAQVHFIFPFGTDHDKELNFAISVLQYLGTSQYLAAELKQEFYKIGMTTDFKTNQDTLFVSLTGLQENLAQGLHLLHDWLSDAQPDQQAYEKYVQTILESRNAAKNDKDKILKALVNYAKYGAFSRATNVVSENRLKKLTCEELTEKVRNLLQFPYEIFYYGRQFEEFKTLIPNFIDTQTLEIPEKIDYPEPVMQEKVYFVPYEMVQMELSKVAKGALVDPQYFGRINVFNEYFGRGLSSIVFQEIREKRSLAYSTYVSYQANPLLQHPDYISTYIGTQPDKLRTAIETLEDLMRTLPQIELQFNNAKTAVLKQIASTRFTRTNIFFNYLNLQKLGVNYDIRKDMYQEIQQLTLPGLVAFYNLKVKPLRYNTALIGKKESLNKDTLQALGEIEEVGLEEIFGF